MEVLLNDCFATWKVRISLGLFPLLPNDPTRDTAHTGRNKNSWWLISTNTPEHTFKHSLASFRQKWWSVWLKRPVYVAFAHSYQTKQKQHNATTVRASTWHASIPVSEAWRPSPLWNRSGRSGFLKLNDKCVCVCVRLGVLINTLLIISANYFLLKFFTFTAIFLLQDVSTDLNATPLIIFHMSATRKSLSGKASDSSPLIKSPIKYSYHWK